MARFAPFKARLTSAWRRAPASSPFPLHRVRDRKGGSACQVSHPRHLSWRDQTSSSCRRRVTSCRTREGCLGRSSRHQDLLHASLLPAQGARDLNRRGGAGQFRGRAPLRKGRPRRRRARARCYRYSARLIARPCPRRHSVRGARRTLPGDALTAYLAAQSSVTTSTCPRPSAH